MGEVKLEEMYSYAPFGTLVWDLDFSGWDSQWGPCDGTKKLLLRLDTFQHQNKNAVGTPLQYHVLSIVHLYLFSSGMHGVDHGNSPFFPIIESSP